MLARKPRAARVNAAAAIPSITATLSISAVSARAQITQSFAGGAAMKATASPRAWSRRAGLLRPRRGCCERARGPLREVAVEVADAPIVVSDLLRYTGRERYQASHRAADCCDGESSN